MLDQLPRCTPLQLITPSRASGTADHVRSLDDLLCLCVRGEDWGLVGGWRPLPTRPQQYCDPASLVQTVFGVTLLLLIKRIGWVVHEYSSPNKPRWNNFAAGCPLSSHNTSPVQPWYIPLQPHTAPVQPHFWPCPPTSDYLLAVNLALLFSFFIDRRTL